MNKASFDIFHPSVAVLYCAGVLVITMAAFQPVLVGASLVVAIAMRILLAGWRSVGRSLVWQFVLLIVIAACNLLLSPNGSTMLFRVGHTGFYLESLVYGLTMGAMIVAVLQWFSVFACVLSTDKVLGLFGDRAPVVGLMIVMCMRLVPQFVARGGEVHDVARACTACGQEVRASDATCVLSAGDATAGDAVRAASRPRGRKISRAMQRLREALRELTVLMGWGMEDSLDRADAMRARGWNSSRKRTAYMRQVFRKRDGIAIAVIAVLLIAVAVCDVVLCVPFEFYPHVGGFGVWWLYLPTALLYALPIVLGLTSEGILLVRKRGKRWV